MEEKKLGKLFAVSPEIVFIIKDWVDRDIETFISNGVISDAKEIPKNREELFKRYVNLFYSLL